ncbi:hypothetical protein B6V74_13000 [Thioclava sp. F42-5]|uniref:hypothetical protein n=1 Tax=Thioclava sp. F42-5 TaxID=1973005 RepID=UPI000B548975|nr:hypothetical protein [Thioclava sp. F42-5]OWY08734.1 hypothetical protein B6V74_13000 [Thioclava sp. F42-5]
MSWDLYQYVPPVLALGFCLFLVLEAKFISWQFDRRHGDERANANGFVSWLLTPTKAELMRENEELRNELARLSRVDVRDRSGSE